MRICVPSADVTISVPARPGQILFGWPYPTSGGTAMNQGGADNIGFLASGAQGATDSILADSMFLSPCGGGYDIKYMDIDDQWHDDGSPLPTAASLFPGQGAWIRRGTSGAGAAFGWTVPKPY